MYNAISDTAASDGYGYGPEGFGYGYEGSISGGDPGGGSISGGPPTMEPGGGGGVVSNPIMVGGGMGPGQGVPGPRHGRLSAGGPGAGMGGLKPMLSQLLGLGSPQMQPRPRPRAGGGNRDPRMQPPIMRGPGMGFGPRPMPRPMPRPVPQPVAGGGTLRGGGGAPVSTPIQRGRVQPGRRQGTI